MKISAPPRSNPPSLDTWLRELYTAIIGLPEEVLFERAGTTISPVTAGDDLSMGTGDITSTNVTAISALTGASITDGIATIAGGVISGSSLSANQVTSGPLDIGTGTFTTSGNIHGNNLILVGFVTADSVNLINDLTCNDISCGNISGSDIGCNDVTCKDVNAQDIIATSLMI